MRLLSVAKSFWIVFCILVLAVTLYAAYLSGDDDIGIFLIGCMTVLAFPSSVLVAGLVTLLVLLQEHIEISFLDVIKSRFVGFALVWLAYFIVGYMQWFLLLPWLWRKWKGRKKKVPASN